MVTESSIKIAEADETSHLLERLWRGPFDDALEFGRIHLDLSIVDNETKKFDSRSEESALFRFYKQIVVIENFENDQDLLNHVSHVARVCDEYVIDIDYKPSLLSEF